MSNTLPEQTTEFPPEPQAPESTTGPSADKLKQPKWAWGWPHLIACICFCSTLLYVGNMRLYHTDLWGHVSYGHWILEHGHLPVGEPFVPHAEGVPVVASAWLGQVFFALIEKWGGAEGLTNLYTFLVLSIAVTAAVIFLLQTKRLLLATIMAIFAMLLFSTRLAVLRTEMFGSLGFMLVLGAVYWGQREVERERATSQTRPLALGVWYLSIVALFVLWANCHGSYIVGIAVLGCQVLGRCVEALWNTRSLTGMLRDRWLHRWLIAAELATVAALINPYGMDLFINTFQFPDNPNLKDITEWWPMSPSDVEGIFFAFCWVAMVFVMRFSRHHVKPADIFMLGVFSYAVIMGVRMIGWFAFVYCYVMTPHIGDLWNRLEEKWKQHRQSLGRPPLRLLTHRSQAITVTCAVMVWVSFMFSPTSRLLLGSGPRPDERLYSAETPRALSKFFREHPPEEQVYNPQWWGDWLVWDGPKGFPVFMTTNSVHVVPNPYWEDYLLITRGHKVWLAILHRYQVSTVVVHKERQETLARIVQKQLSPDWKRVYEDDLALVYSRDPAVLESLGMKPVVADESP